MESTQGGFGSAAQKMKDGAVEMKNRVMETGAQKLEVACQETETLIKENPYRSVLVAFGVGALAGMFLFRR